MSTTQEIESQGQREQRVLEQQAYSLLCSSERAVVLVDLQGRISWNNAAFQTMLLQNATQSQKIFQGLNLQDPQGGILNLSSLGMKVQETLLANPQILPAQLDIAIGEEIYQVYARGLKENTGTICGIALEWQNVTHDRRQGTKANSLSSMVEGASSYFMMCNSNLEITYANPAVIQMMRKYQTRIREFLPTFDVDNLMGQCIDQFHKVPANQRKLLGNPSLLPVRSEVRIGEIVFAVTANALKDFQGKMIGVGVEWTDLNDNAHYSREVDKVLESVRVGDLKYRGSVDSLSAEYKPMMAGINEILDAITAPIAEARDALQTISDQDLTVRIENDYEGDHAAIKNNLNKTMDTLEGAIIQVNSTVGQVNTASGQIAEGAKKIADGANQQASSIEQISSSLEEMSSMVAQNADNAEQAKGLSRNAQSAAEKGGEAMERMANAINLIKASSDQTSKIIKTIDEIAFQTNLLALNAAVEAARAGNAGKGFAVVAEEVRSLAQRSADAARNTADMIEESVNNADGGVRISEEVSDVLSEILSGNTKVHNLINEIAAASKEQSDGIHQINQAVVSMDRVIQENAANSEQSAGAAQQLSEQVVVLSTLVTRFKTSEKKQAAPSKVQPVPSAASPAALLTATAQPALEAVEMATEAEALFPLDEDDFGDF